MVLQKPLTAIFAAFLLLLEPYTVAFPALKLGSYCCCCYSVLKELIPSSLSSCIAGFSTPESTIGGVAHKRIVLYDGVSGGFCYRSSCRRLSLSTSIWEGHKCKKNPPPPQGL
eukprot:419320_1